MGARTITGISTTGTVNDPRFPAQNGYFTVNGMQNSDLFVGVSGTYTGLSLQIQGARTDQSKAGANGAGPWYDIGSYTTDGIGPLATPLSPASNASMAFLCDVRQFNFYQITILSLASGSVTMELLDEGFFPPRPALANGALVQVVYELRYLNSIMTGWVGQPNGQLLAMPALMQGTGIGGSFQGGA